MQQESWPLFESKLGPSLPIIGNYIVAILLLQMQKSGFLSLTVLKGFNSRDDSGIAMFLGAVPAARLPTVLGTLGPTFCLDYLQTT